MAKVRTAFVGEVTKFVSPEDPEVEFGIKRIGNREYIAHQNLSSKVRYIQEEAEDQRFVSEKDFPTGTMRLETVLLGLTSWSLLDAANRELPITKDNVLDLLSPGELDFLHDKVLELNPVLSGKEARKKD